MKRFKQRTNRIRFARKGKKGQGNRGRGTRQKAAIAVDCAVMGDGLD
jgi:hypothetical protein